MPIDRKYGRVQLERGTVGRDEPVVVFRAQDKFLTTVLDTYYRMCIGAGSPPAHLEGIQASIDIVTAWQGEHHTQVPRSDPPTKIYVNGPPWPVVEPDRPVNRDPDNPHFYEYKFRHDGAPYEWTLMVDHTRYKGQVRARVELQAPQGRLCLQYLDDDGKLLGEVFWTLPH